MLFDRKIMCFCNPGIFSLAGIFAKNVISHKDLWRFEGTADYRNESSCDWNFQYFPCSLHVNFLHAVQREWLDIVTAGLAGWSESFPKADSSSSSSSSLSASANCQPHHRCWFIALIIHQVAHSLLCWPDASLHCQSVSAAHWTEHVTDPEIRHKYLKKYIYTPETANGAGSTSEKTAIF